MQTYGIIADGKAVPNVTLTTYSDERDRAVSSGICAKKDIHDEKGQEQVLSNVVTRGIRRRVVQQGAADVRLFPSPKG